MHSTAQHSTAQHSTAQHSTAQHTHSTRIEYIDALRGFTMLLVVMTHVSGFVLGSDGEANYHYYIRQFRMPLFFFVSGFVFYKNCLKWNLSNTTRFLKKKINVQIITPFIFLLCYVHTKEIALIDSLKDVYKSGYWFTFTLFNYFILYILSQKIFDLFKIGDIWRFTLLILSGISLYNHFPINILYRMGYSTEISLLGLTQLKYFIYFIIGCLTKKHFRLFENSIDKTPLIIIAIALYFLINIFVDINELNRYTQNNITLLLGLCGITIVFSLFRKHQATFSSNNRISNLLKIIGSRTLDIYLIHYFFIPFNLYEAFPLFVENDIPIIEFATTLAITTLIVAASLAISSILRINNTMAHYLFGAKK